MTRRKDNELRVAIDDIQECPSQKRSIKDVYDKILCNTILVTGSKCGIIFSYNAKEYTHHVLISSFDTVCAQGQPKFCIELINSGLSHCTELLSRQEAQLARGEPITLIQPLAEPPSKKLPAPFNEQPMLNLIPIMDKSNCYAVMLLGGQREINSHDLHRLWPLLSAATAAKNTFLKERNNHLLKHLETKSINRQMLETSYKQLFNQLQEFSFNAILITNKNNIIQSANRVARTMLGAVDDRDVVGKCLADFLLESFPNELQIRTSSFNDLELVKNRFFPSKMQCRSLNGRISQIEMTFFQFQLSGEKQNIFLLDDKTNLIREQQFREEEERRFLAVADLVPIGILQTNERWECEYVNTAWCQMAGLSRDEVQGLGWVNAIHDEDSHRIINEMSVEIRKGNRYEETCRFQNPLGEILWVDLNASPLISEDGAIEGFIATANDVTLHRSTEERLRKVAQHDPLTQLANRSLLYERLSHLLTRLPRSNTQVAVLYVDLDGFKQINDSLGHDSGDAVLKDVASRLLNCVRQNDTVSRLGGDEFIVILEDIKNPIAASEVADKIIQAIALPFCIGSQEIFLTTSVGVTLSDSDNIDCSQLLKQADIALYQAKAEGKNNQQFYTVDFESDSRERLLMCNALHRALEKNEFEVYYQPQAHTETGAIVGFEALLRWIPENGESVPTEQFISLLEETGLIQSIGRWLILEATNQFQKWVVAGLVDESAHLCINLSPRQFRDKRLLPSIEQAIIQSAINPQNIVFEITETLLLDHTERSKELISTLKGLGAKIALDDFGTGFSSLSHLKNFPIDIIKIDQSFVRDVLVDKEDEAIIRAVLAMADSLDKKTIAEGVDSDAKLQHLQKLGCEVYQGFLLSRPVTSAAIELLLLSIRLPKNKTTIEVKGIFH